MATAELMDWTRRLSRLTGAVSLVGTGKNAGKTTLLNFLLRHLPPRQIGVTSIGLDGERLDLIERLAKPSIHLGPGSLFATAKECLARCQGSWSVVKKTRFRTALGPVSICRVNTHSQVELAGPSRAADLANLLQAMRDSGAHLTLTDGAFDRRSSAAAGICQGVVAAVGSVGKPDIEAASREAWALLNRHRLQKWEESAKFPFSPQRMNALLDSDLDGLENRPILLPDPSGCLLGPEAWRRVQVAGIRIWVERPVLLLGLFVSSFRPHRLPLDSAALLARVRELCGDLPVFDLSLEGELGAPQSP